MNMSGEDFGQLVKEAMAALPRPLKDRLENIEVVVDEVTSGERPLLGLYQGIPLPERGENYSGALPDKITIFKKALEAGCRSEAEIQEAVRDTVIHEVAHYFGFSDREIHDLGY